MQGAGASVDRAITLPAPHFRDQVVREPPRPDLDDAATVMLHL